MYKHPIVLSSLRQCNTYTTYINFSREYIPLYVRDVTMKNICRRIHTIAGRLLVEYAIDQHPMCPRKHIRNHILIRYATRYFRVFQLFAIQKRNESRCVKINVAFVIYRKSRRVSRDIPPPFHRMTSPCNSSLLSSVAIV